MFFLFNASSKNNKSPSCVLERRAHVCCQGFSFFVKCQLKKQFMYGFSVGCRYSTQPKFNDLLPFCPLETKNANLVYFSFPFSWAATIKKLDRKVINKVQLRLIAAIGSYLLTIITIIIWACRDSIICISIIKATIKTNYVGDGSKDVKKDLDEDCFIFLHFLLPQQLQRRALEEIDCWKLQQMLSFRSFQY